ncbi:hypothetical protein AB0O91_30205 [Kitasatospora sp. NPDC089797]|uniref:hypothetical protein n=1 Tax=Kitasatospora sp. NPDC089797 TaxID=3155298 RepID=UPI003431AEED
MTSTDTVQLATDTGIRPGRIVTLLGIDASGKDVLAEGLVRHLTARGTSAQFLPRRHYLLGEPTGPTADLNRTLYDGALRAFYTGARTPDGTEVCDLIAPDADLRGKHITRALTGVDIAYNNPRTVLASSITEIAGSLAYWESVLLPKAREGQVVIDTPHLIRAVVKGCTMVQHHADEGTALDRQAAQVMACAREVLRPDPALTVPVLLRVTPELAYERRVAQHGGLGPLEHYGQVGGHATRDAYLDLQRRVQAELEVIAAHWRAVVVDMDPDWHDAWPAALEAILGDERMRL